MTEKNLNMELSIKRINEIIKQKEENIQFLESKKVITPTQKEFDKAINVIKNSIQKYKEIKAKKEIMEKEIKKEIEIIWIDNSKTIIKADFLSFDNHKLNIEIEDDVLVYPLKNIKKIKFSKHLLKSDYYWNWTFKTYEDSTSDKNPYVSPFIWYKYTSNIDTAGNPTW